MKILLLEDDVQLRDHLHTQLTQQGCEPDIADTLRAASSHVRHNHYDLYIVDRILPDGDGRSWLQSRRAADDATPALFLTALGSIADKVDGLQLADDYLVKPFAFEELWARIQALLRRSIHTDTQEVLTSGALRLDRLKRMASLNGKKLSLKPMEFKLLEYLMLHQGNTVTRKMVLESVWGFNFDPSTNIVQTYISRLRTQIDSPGAPTRIETLRGEGYRLLAGHLPVDGAP